MAVFFDILARTTGSAVDDMLAPVKHALRRLRKSPRLCRNGRLVIEAKDGCAIQTPAILKLFESARVVSRPVDAPPADRVDGHGHRNKGVTA